MLPLLHIATAYVKNRYEKAFQKIISAETSCLFACKNYRAHGEIMERV